MTTKDPALLERTASDLLLRASTELDTRKRAQMETEAAQLAEMARVQRADEPALARVLHAALQRKDISVARLLNRSWGELADAEQEVFRAAARALLSEL